MGILVAFWILFTVTYLGATELLSMAKSKGEVLIFRRSYFVEKRSSRQTAEADDEEAPRPAKTAVMQSVQTDDTYHRSNEGQTFHWEDVCYDIKNKGVTQRILDHVDGWVQPGSLTALMVSG